ncbi:hypothetical protein TSMEX_008290 [Taenia solium]|eukprot:TsM_001132500 transcript=TsM_001132500 gene=TsM_001132500
MKMQKQNIDSAEELVDGHGIDDKAGSPSGAYVVVDGDYVSAAAATVADSGAFGGLPTRLKFFSKLHFLLRRTGVTSIRLAVPPLTDVASNLFDNASCTLRHTTLLLNSIITCPPQ